eukprot:TRINITY_DN3923_c1_g1_i2.p1 TRINITY_DN3923_c1_g1~~TRINITY_DN3923_c1_g1_i2.p1  ORF type:complete len:141 (+),score=27.21 TRINITY_DN3923_c1_g1_i2:139-561(+)
MKLKFHQGKNLDIGTALLFNTLGMFSTVLLTQIMGWEKFSMRTSWTHLWAILCGALWTLADLAYFRLSALGIQVSLLAPITSLEILVPICLGVVFLGEPMTRKKLFGIVCAFFAIYLLSHEESSTSIAPELIHPPDPIVL